MAAGNGAVLRAVTGLSYRMVRSLRYALFPAAMCCYATQTMTRKINFAVLLALGVPSLQTAGLLSKLIDGSIVNIQRIHVNYDGRAARPYNLITQKR